ncbi:MAG: MoaD/ThiS family protein [Bacteroidetes bacterium]|nr:MAG: MoaD/ThiS family protein [Bacteroidota bacterium]
MRLHLPEPATAADVLDELARRFPVVDRYRPVLRLAVNEHYEPASVRLAEGDEVALITPVSGG